MSNWFHGQPQRSFDGPALRQYAQYAGTENPDSKHWENTANELLRTARRLIDTREMQKAADMMSADWFERRTWKQLSEAWQRVLCAAAVKPLDAVGICELLAAPELDRHWSDNPAHYGGAQ